MTIFSFTHFYTNVNSEAMQEALFTPNLLSNKAAFYCSVNSGNQLEPVANSVWGNIFSPEATIPIAWIPIDFTGFHISANAHL